MKKRILSIICVLAICVTSAFGTSICTNATTDGMTGVTVQNSINLGLGETINVPIKTTNYTLIDVFVENSSIISGIPNYNNCKRYSLKNTGTFKIPIKGLKIGTTKLYAGDRTCGDYAVGYINVHMV